MRLIDADALKELFSAVIGGIAAKLEMTGSLEHMIRASAMVMQMIDDAPTIDDVSVVRCKDCEHCYFASNRVPDEQSYACEKHGIDVTPDWFCADGERQEGR